MSNSLKVFYVLILSTALCACQSAPKASLQSDVRPEPDSKAGILVEYLNPETHFDSPAYSQVAVVRNRGKTFYISGQIPVNINYELLAPGDIRGQTKAALENLDMALRAAAIEKDDIVKINVGIVSLEARDSFIVVEELIAYFGRVEMPASTLSGAPFIVSDGILVQIDAIAVTE